MADFVFNIAKGKVSYYAGLPAANDALLLIPLETTGLEADSVLRDKDTFADVVSGATNEQTTLPRKTLASVTVTVDDANDRIDVDAADVSYTSAGGNAVSAFVICYDPDTTGGSDSDLIPLVKLDLAFTPSGDFNIVFNSAGFYRAS